MNWIYCLLLLLCPYISPAQVKDGPLTIGDAFPYMVCSNVLNHGAGTIDLAAYKGKVLVLDFMNTGCVGCLQKLPDYDSLQQLFSGSIQFLIVTAQPAATVQKFLQQHRLGKLVHFPVIANDSKLKALFPHEYISHLVVIGADGIVKAITHGEYITASNIRSLLSGEALNLPLKKDLLDFDYSLPLVSHPPTVIKPSSPMLSSVFSGYLPEVGSRQILFTPATDSTTIRTVFYNQPVIALYTGLYGKQEFAPAQTVLQVKDSSRYILNESITPWHSWMAANSYCYESILPASMPRPLQQQRIHEELDFYLGLHTRFETRLMNCLLLQRGNQSIAAPATPGKGFTLHTIAFELNRLWDGLPVLLDTLIPADMRIEVPKYLLRKRSALEPLLHQAGFVLVPVQRPIEVLVITENNFYKPKN